MTATQITHKICSHCKTDKLINDFGICATYKDGRRGQCNQCRSKLHSAYVKSHPAKRKKPSPNANRRNNLKTKYGLTEKQYEKILADQNGVCAICKTDSGGGRYGVFHIDHCHTTGRVRGILCNNCNVTLGKMGDSIDGVMRYLNYLQRSERLAIHI